MSAPLFTDRDPCGCERALGHVCCPPFASAENWPSPAELQGCDVKMEGTQKMGAPNLRLTDPGLRPTLSRSVIAP